MADREMVAATLAAALLQGREFSGPHSNPAGYAVMVYRQVLNALRDSEPAPATAQSGPPTKP